MQRDGATAPSSGPPITLIKPIRDRGVVPIAGGGGRFDRAASQLERPDATLFDRLGPSAKCANPALIDATWARARWSAAHSLLVWVVDDAPTLETLLQFGVGNVISNRPLHVRALARALCNRSRGGGANGGALSGGGVVDDELNCAGRGSHTCTV